MKNTYRNTNGGDFSAFSDYGAAMRAIARFRKNDTAPIHARFGRASKTAARHAARIPDLRRACENMVRSQIQPCGVKDRRILEAFREIERDEFIPRLRGMTAAYADQSIALGDKRWCMEPRVLAKMMQAAEIGPQDKALDFACGTGYATALLGRVAGCVTGVDSAGELALSARYNLHRAGIWNARVRVRDLDDPGTLDERYDVILVTGGAVMRLPKGIESRLNAGGRIIAVMREKNGPFCPGIATLFETDGGILREQTLFDAHVPLMPDFTFRPGVAEEFGMNGKIFGEEVNRFPSLNV